MRRLFLIAGVLLVASIPAKAQDHPGYEVFGGYSLLNTKFFDRENLHGFAFSVAGNLGPTWGLVAEVSGHYGSTSGLSLRKYTYLFGPRFSSRSDKATVFGHVLLGGANSKIEGTDIGSGFALAVGGGVDLNVNKSVAVRILQVDYLPDRSFGVWTQNARVSAGVVFKLGQ